MERPAIEGTMTSRSALLGGCAVILVLLGGAVLLAFWLFDALADGGGGRRPDQSAGPRVDGVDGDERLTRSRRQELEVEVAEVEHNLEFARAQARVTIDKATRGAWEARVEELETRRDELRRQLGR